jgi:hypothetical protein
MIKKYIMLEDSKINTDVKKGDIVFHCMKWDYGVANDDTRYFGEEYISVTLDKNGDYPFFTVPVRHLGVYHED